MIVRFVVVYYISLLLLVDFTLSGAAECNIQLLPFIMFHIGPEGRPVFCAPYNFESFNNDDAFSNHLIIDTLRRPFWGRVRTRARKSKAAGRTDGAKRRSAWWMARLGFFLATDESDCGNRERARPPPCDPGDSARRDRFILDRSLLLGGSNSRRSLFSLYIYV